MQVQETTSEGLRREYRITVPATDLDEKVNTRLEELKNRVQIRGFRPGKVPLTHLKRVYGKSVMAETIDAAVQEANAKIVSDGGFRVAMEPKITFPTEEAEVTALIEGRSDLTYTLAIEILPKIELADVRSITHLRRITANPTCSALRLTTSRTIWVCRSAQRTSRPA